MTNIKEILNYISDRLELARKQNLDLQKELLVTIFHQHEDEIRRIGDLGKPFMVILGKELSTLEPLFAEYFKTYVSRFMEPYQILVTIEYDPLEESMLASYVEDPYWAAHFTASPWFSVYGQIKKGMRPWDHTSP